MPKKRETHNASNTVAQSSPKIAPTTNLPIQNQTKIKKPNDKGSPKKPPPPPDKLAVFVDSFLDSWKDKYPNEQFWNELLNFMHPHENLVHGQLRGILREFSGVIGRHVQYFKLHPFGSMATGLAFRDSDFDILVETKVPAERIGDLMQQVTRMMRWQKQWGQVTPIIKTRVPLIKSASNFSGKECDFSFTDNMYSLYNTQLIRHLLVCDRRIRPLTMLLKYWFRVNGIAGTGKFTSFALFVMIVFYLQTIPDPILPPLIEFQRRVPAIDVNGWNVAIDMKYTFPTTNTSSVFYLLYGFFGFYAAFDFDKNLVCTMMGRTYDRKTLHDEPRAPELSAYFRYLEREPKDGLNADHQICVQDPHRLNVNVTRCSAASFLMFKQHLHTMCQHILHAPADQSERVQLLAELFAMRATPIKKVRGPRTLQISPFKSELDALTAHLGGEPDAETVMQRWREQSVEFFDQMLRGITALDVETDTSIATAGDAMTVVRRYKVTVHPDKSSFAENQPAATDYKVRNLERKLKALHNFLKQEKPAGLQFDITLGTIGDGCDIHFNVDSERCTAETLSDAAKRQFERLRTFLLTTPAIRCVITARFKDLNPV